jgi:hypothetical protein
MKNPREGFYFEFNQRGMLHHFPFFLFIQVTFFIRNFFGLYNRYSKKASFIYQAKITR